MSYLILAQNQNPNKPYAECELVLRYLPDMGIGIYAGVLFTPESDLEYGMISIPLSNEIKEESVADLYIEGLNDTHNSLTLGYALVYNHAPLADGHMLSKYNDPDEALHEFKYHPDKTFNIHYKTLWTLFPGDQIFSWYGDQWFVGRLEELSTRKTSNRDVLHIDDVQQSPGRIPGCAHKYTKIIGQHLISKEFIPKDTTIEIARALLLPFSQNLVRSGPLTEFVWFSSSAKEPVLTLPFKYGEDKSFYNSSLPYVVSMLGNGMLYSAVPENTIPNVNYDWWDLSMEGIIPPPSSTTCDSSSESSECVYSNLKRTEYGSLCATQMLVSFIANRDILIGELLTIDLKEDPITGFRYANDRFASQCL
eukprot:gene12650-16959_t